VETAASYEARYAPPPYPTIIRSPIRAMVLPDQRGDVTCPVAREITIRQALA